MVLGTAQPGTPDESSAGWYNGIGCISLVTHDGKSQHQIHILNILTRCIFLTALQTGFATPGEGIAQCLRGYDLDPDSPAVLELLIITPAESCVDTDQLEEDHSNVRDVILPNVTVIQVVCVAVWDADEGRLNVAPNEMFMCVVNASTSLPADAPLVSRTSYIL